MNPVYVLAIQDGHNCTAALLKDGEILGVVSEERFNRIKNFSGFPTQSIEWLFREFGITAANLDAAVICGESFNLPFSTGASESVVVRKGFSAGSKVYGALEYRSGPLYKPLFKIKSTLIDRSGGKKHLRHLIERLNIDHGIAIEKISCVEHHLCHSYAAYYGLSENHERALVLTLDGEGDQSSATVNIFEGYEHKTLASTWRHHSLGYAYSLTTQFMGMTPLEHEYKVMGLAPYASSKEQKYYLKTYERVFKDVMWLDKDNPLVFKSKFPMNRFTHWLQQRAVGERFDNLAGALQHFTEDLASRWVSAAVEKTGIGNIYCGGGVFMNVKMNMVLSELPQVKNLRVLPSCGDESNPIGACYYTYIRLCKQQGRAPSVRRIKDLYLGPSFDEEVPAYIKEHNLKDRYIIKKADPKIIASMLAKGEIIARCAGRMEWGARSLGNRCIMANPSDLRYVWQINEQIKMRDFWMPFAPSMLKEKAPMYVENPKKLEAPYMIMAFHTTDKARTQLRAAMHQSDATVRPQLVERSWNPRYYDIIKEFEKKTGIGAVLNTSFNLHGKPIVMTPHDAVEEVFEHSGLQHLILGDYLLSKRLASAKASAPRKK